MNSMDRTHNRFVPLTLDQVRESAPSAFATQAHSSRSARYAYIPTVNVINGLIKNGFQPFSATQSRTRIAGKADFTKHMIRFRHPDAKALVVGDTVPEIAMVNSHDGSSAYKLFAAFFRLVCSNGLMVSDAAIAEVNIKHTGDVVGEVIEGAYKVIEGTDRAAGAIQEWRGLQLTEGETEVFARAAHTIRFADSEGKTHTPILPSQLLSSRRYQDNGDDLWSTFNRVQENVIKGGIHQRQARRDNERRGRLVSTREVRGIDQDIKLNQGLWQLAQGMANLKTGRVTPEEMALAAS